MLCSAGTCTPCPLGQAHNRRAKTHVRGWCPPLGRPAAASPAAAVCAEPHAAAALCHRGRLLAACLAQRPPESLGQPAQQAAPCAWHGYCTLVVPAAMTRAQSQCRCWAARAHQRPAPGHHPAGWVPEGPAWTRLQRHAGPRWACAWRCRRQCWGCARSGSPPARPCSARCPACCLPCASCGAAQRTQRPICQRTGAATPLGPLQGLSGAAGDAVTASASPEGSLAEARAVDHIQREAGGLAAGQPRPRQPALAKAFWHVGVLIHQRAHERRLASALLACSQTPVRHMSPRQRSGRGLSAVPWSGPLE